MPVAQLVSDPTLHRMDTSDQKDIRYHKINPIEIPGSTSLLLKGMGLSCIPECLNGSKATAVCPLSLEAIQAGTAPSVRKAAESSDLHRPCEQKLRCLGSLLAGSLDLATGKVAAFQIYTTFDGVVGGSHQFFFGLIALWLRFQTQIPTDLSRDERAKQLRKDSIWLSPKRIQQRLGLAVFCAFFRPMRLSLTFKKRCF